MKSIFLLVLSMFVCLSVYGQCDLTRFADECAIPFTTKGATDRSQVYCGEQLGYISRAHFEVLRRYQRANTNMILTVNGEYYDSPCIPFRR